MTTPKTRSIQEASADLDDDDAADVDRPGAHDGSTVTQADLAAVRRTAANPGGAADCHLTDWIPDDSRVAALPLSAGGVIASLRRRR